MLPSPYRPRVLPCSSLPTRPALTLDQEPARVAVAAATTFRDSARARAKTCSATAWLFCPGVTVTHTPCVGGGGDVDVVAADAMPGNDFQLGDAGDHLGGEGLGAEHHRVDVVADIVVADGLWSVAEVDGAGFGEAGEDVGVDRVGHVDGGHGGLLGNGRRPEVGVDVGRSGAPAGSCRARREPGQERGGSPSCRGGRRWRGACGRRR